MRTYLTVLVVVLCIQVVAQLCYLAFSIYPRTIYRESWEEVLRLVETLAWAAVGGYLLLIP